MRSRFIDLMYKKIHSVTTNLSHMLAPFLSLTRHIEECISFYTWAVHENWRSKQSKRGCRSLSAWSDLHKSYRKPFCSDSTLRPLASLSSCASTLLAVISPGCCLWFLEWNQRLLLFFGYFFSNGIFGIFIGDDLNNLLLLIQLMQNHLFIFLISINLANHLLLSLNFLFYFKHTSASQIWKRKRVAITSKPYRGLSYGQWPRIRVGPIHGQAGWPGQHLCILDH